MRRLARGAGAGRVAVNFPSFSEGLSLRLHPLKVASTRSKHFPSFSEGLSLRPGVLALVLRLRNISLPFRRDFH